VDEANECAASLLGAPLDRVLGRPLAGFVDARSRRELNRLIERIAASTIVSGSEVTLTHGNEVRTLELRGTSDPGAGEGACRFAITDVTDRVRACRAHSRQRSRLARMSRRFIGLGEDANGNYRLLLELAAELVGDLKIEYWRDGRVFLMAEAVPYSASAPTQQTLSTHCGKLVLSWWRTANLDDQQVLDIIVLAFLRSEQREESAFRHAEQETQRSAGQTPEPPGELAGGIAREFKDLLTVITGASQRAASQRCVVVVDDDDAVRDIAVQALEQAGVVVLGFGSAESALFASPAADLLITDVVLPGMNGFELAAELHNRLPQLTVLFTSGRGEDVVVHGGSVDMDKALLAKPYAPSELVARAMALLSLMNS
jgi:CheY-like chemotaxis protein